MQSQLEMVHPEKYAAAIKVVDKFVSKSGLRMMLQLIKHKEDGSLEAIDSHQLVKIKDAHGFKEQYLVNAKSLEFAKGQYPETERLLEESPRTVIRLNQQQVKIWLQMHKSMNQMKKIKSFTLNSLGMEISKDQINFEIKDEEISFKLPFEEIGLDPEVNKVNYQIEYMRNALEAKVVLQSSEVLIKLSSAMRPIVLDNEKDVQAVVLPVRTY